MSRYIDADNMKSIKNIQSANFNSIESIREWIDAQPAADVVEVVRCKDCKHQRRKWHDDKRFQDGGYFIVGCMRNGDPFVMHTVDGHDTDFCSYGERAEE